MVGAASTEFVWPEDMENAALDRFVLKELSSLSDVGAERVAKHLIAAGLLVDDDPEAALAHALAAQDLAPRHACVREAVGVSAYLAGDYAQSRSALRSWRRMTGSAEHLAVLADTERALGDPGRALDVLAEAGDAGLSLDIRIEIAIVASGARRDLQQPLAAAVSLEPLIAQVEDSHPGAGRLLFAYAQALLEADRGAAARTAFIRAASADEDLDEAVAEALSALESAQQS